MGAGRLISGVALRLAVEHPERNINAANLLHMIFIGEGFWARKIFSLVVLFEGLDSILLAEPERG